MDLLLAGDPDAQIVLMGDFNDEPFASVMDATLLSTRDRKLVQQEPRLLYNPFWRHMTSYKHSEESHQFSDRGTYFHAAGQLTKWRTFDQMMFSSSLVRGTAEWVLDEIATRVVDFPALTKLVESRGNVFDHLPIVGRLQRSA